MSVTLINTVEGITRRVSPSLFDLWQDALPTAEELPRHLDSLPAWLESEKKWLEDHYKENPVPDFVQKHGHLNAMYTRLANETKKLSADQWRVDHVLSVWKKLQGKAAVVYVLGEADSVFKAPSSKDVLVASPELTVMISHSKDYINIHAFVSHPEFETDMPKVSPYSLRLEEVIGNSEPIQEMLKTMIGAHARVTPDSALRVHVYEYCAKDTHRLAMLVTEFLDGRTKHFTTLVKERTIPNLKKVIGGKSKVYKSLKARDDYHVDVVQKMRMFDEDLSATGGVTDAEESSESEAEPASSSEAEAEAEPATETETGLVIAVEPDDWKHEDRILTIIETKIVDGAKFSAPLVTPEEWKAPVIYFEDTDVAKYITVPNPKLVHDGRKRKCVIQKELMWNLLHRVKPAVLVNQQQPYVSRFLVEAFSASYDDMEYKEKRLVGRARADKQNIVWDMLLCIDWKAQPDTAVGRTEAYPRLCSYLNREARGQSYVLEDGAAVMGYIPALAVNFRILKDMRPFALLNVLTDMIYKIPLRALITDILGVQIPADFDDGTKDENDDDTTVRKPGVLSMTLAKVMPYAVMEDPSTSLDRTYTKKWNKFLWQICAPVCVRCRNALSEIRSEADVKARCDSNPDGTGLLCASCYVRMGMLIYAGTFSKHHTLDNIEGFNANLVEFRYDPEASQNRLNWFGFPTLQVDATMQFDKRDVELFRRDPKHRYQVSNYLWSLLPKDCDLGVCVVEQKREQEQLGGKDYFTQFTNSVGEIASEHLDIFEVMSLKKRGGGRGGVEERKGVDNDEDEDEEGEDEDEEGEEEPAPQTETMMEMETARGVSVRVTESQTGDEEQEQPMSMVFPFQHHADEAHLTQAELEQIAQLDTSTWLGDPFAGLDGAGEEDEDSRTPSHGSVSVIPNPQQAQYNAMSSQGQTCPPHMWNLGSTSRLPPAITPDYVRAPPQNHLTQTSPPLPGNRIMNIPPPVPSYHAAAPVVEPETSSRRGSKRHQRRESFSDLSPAVRRTRRGEY